MASYYNEHDQGAAAWLRNLIQAGHIAAGDVDERSIADVQPTDLAGYDQCHFFAGLGGWAYACRLAGWPDGRPIWTGSPPCQPYSRAGKQRGASDDSDLWPHLFRLASSCRPDVLMGEQVAAAVGKDWLDRVHADMAGIGYACGAVVVPACAVNAPHRRDRLWFVAHAISEGLAQRVGNAGVSGSLAGAVERQDPADDAGAVADADQLGAFKVRLQRGRELGRFGGHPRVGNVADAHGGGRRPGPDDAPTGHGQAVASEGRRGAWDGADWIAGNDGKARRVEPGIRLLDHGVAGRMAVVRPRHGADASDQEEALYWYRRTNALKCLGNAIVPQVAAEVIGAYMDEHPW
jgi:DNA (cytosine-5)-methyltransferase 1